MRLFNSERFADHLTPPGHPERPERAEVLRRVALEWAARGHQLDEPVPADDATLSLVHAPAYVAAIRETAGHAIRLDADTTTSPDSYDVARLAAGAVIEGIRHVLATPDDPAAVLVRPPGHHAEVATAMGFCLFNSIAVGAAWARRQGLQRVAIVDFDVHHGNGTEDIIAGDERVLMVSFFQHPLYPFSGGTPLGTNMLNLPVPAYTRGPAIRELIEMMWMPRLEEFKPQMVFISAGFDAHREDELGQLGLIEADYEWITARLMALAARHAQGRIVSCLEGGYSLSALARSVAAHLRVLADM